MSNVGRLRRQRGAALISTLLASALLAVIASLASQQAIVSWLVGQRMRESAEALIAAESGLSAALADFAVEPRWERFELPDQGPYPFLDAGFAVPLPDSFHVETKIVRRSPDRVDLVAVAQGRNRARRILAATIRDSGTPYVPAALHLPTGTTIALKGDFALAGETASDNPVPAIATAAQADADRVRTQLESAGARIDGESTTAKWSDLGDTLQSLRATAATLPTAPAGSMPAGVWKSIASLEIGNVTATGVWLVDGDLTVNDSMGFEGLLLVAGDLLISSGASLTVEGALAIAPPGRSLQSRGTVEVRYRADALGAIESLEPGILDRRARLLGWRDDS